MDGNAVEHDESRRGARRPLSVQTVIAVVLLMVMASGLFVFVARVASDQRDRVLEKRSDEVASLISSALGEVRSALGLLRSLSADDDRVAFEKASASLLTGAVRAVGRADQDGQGTFVVGAGAGDISRGVGVSSDRAQLLRRAMAADDVVSGVIQTPQGSRVMFALPDPSGSQVVFRETEITPNEVKTVVRGRAFADLEVSLYATAQPTPGSLILTTVAPPLTRGRSTPITVGVDTWLLVTTPRGELDGAISWAAKWVVLAFGTTVALVVGGLVEVLARRRRFALLLVARRTNDLEQALVERSRLEEGQRLARMTADAANQAKSEFLSRMSHELRTPLNAVLGFAQLLQREPLTDDQHDCIKQITTGGWHLLRLINEVLDITHIETGSIPLSPEPVLAADVLTETLELMRPLAEQRGIHLMSNSTPGCDAYVYADRQRVKQILLNLASNAIKYNRTGGTVAVRCVHADGRLRIRVTDTGPGIAAEHLSLLFAPFERLGAEHSDVEGTGLGLALSRRLAEAMGGALDVETEVGRGATFVLELPLVEGPVERLIRLGPTVPAQPAAGGAPTQKLLYIEDNVANLRLIERLFSDRADVQVIAAMQGRLGLELCHQHRPAVVVLDLHLPDIDGVEVLVQLRDDPLTAAIPVIVVSADATPGQIGRVVAAGAYDYLTKPLDVNRFLTLVDSILLAAQRPDPVSVL